MNLCTVIRTVGERTTATCQTLLAAAGPVTTVGHAPFPDTLAASLRAGLNAGRKWTLCVDADVLPLRDAVRTLVGEAERLDDSIAEVQPVVFDRFFGGWRPAGVHLYRTRHLQEALDVLASLPSSIRPEASLLGALAARGLGWHQCAVEFGLHDFEQAPQDVYRKAFVHARKHGDLAPALERYWQSRAGVGDFSIALSGLRAGAAHDGAVALDAAAPYMRWPGEAMRSPLDRCSFDDVEQVLGSEEETLRSTARDVAPVWDWIDEVWAAENGLARTIEAFVRSLLCTHRGSCVVDRIDARTRILVNVGARWGLTFAGIVAPSPTRRTSFAGVPVVSPEAVPTSALRIQRSHDGRLAALAADRVLLEPALSELPSRKEETQESEVVNALVRRVLEAGVPQVLIYGAGAFGIAVAEALKGQCAVAAFIESDPSKRGGASTSAPVIDVERALTSNPGTDVVIASVGSASAMVARLLNAARTLRRNPGRIWLLDAA